MTTDQKFPGRALLLRNTTSVTTDWFELITQLMRSGIPQHRIGEAMGDIQLTDSMMRHYRAGTEPLHWRGEKLISFWCAITEKARDDRPMAEIVRGRYRATQRTSVELIAIRDARPPTATPVLASTVMKRKPGRPAGSGKKKAEVA